MPSNSTGDSKMDFETPNQNITPDDVEAYQDWGTRTPEEWEIRKYEAAEMMKAIFGDDRALGGPGSGNFGHSGRPGQVGGSGEGGYEDFERRALENLQETSRTAKGVSDTSSSVDKQKLAVSEGEKLAAKTAENFKGALRRVWDDKNREFKSAAEVHKFTEDLARKVNEGVLPAGQGLYRTWETPNNQTPPKEIREATRAFSGQLYEKLSSGADPVSTAAWVEKRMSVIHPWADGVGRTTKALSAFVLVRGGQQIPKYPDRKTYYAEIRKSPESWERYYRSLM